MPATSSDAPVTLYVHRAERSDRLVVALAELLATPLQDVFAEEVVAVPARGVERWLTQQLSHRLGRRDGREDGICAGIRFPSPTALLSQVTRECGATGGDDPAIGIDSETDRWSADAMVWPLLEVIDECAGQAWCRTLGAHLGIGAVDEQERTHRRGRRFAVARRLAGLFDSYATNRPEMIGDWAQGDDTDGFGRSLPDDLVWQARLWRLVGERVGGLDPVARRTFAAGRLREEPAAVDLPERLSIFGPTRIPRSYLELLEALGEHRDVHLWLPHPSPVLWDRLSASPPVPRMAPSADEGSTWTRRDDPTVTITENPLLASLGRDSRELQLTLSALEVVDVHHELPPRPSTLLGLLQGNIRDDTTAAPATIAVDDRTVQVHACHGPGRQVDVLREVLVGLLAADPSLEPRDVLVMCPDIEAYAPLIAAAFGLADVVDEGKAHPAHRLRVRLADRALTRTNPLLATVARLLELADGRVTASQVLDLAAWPPVRRRFRFADDELDRLARWVAQSGVRWGLDGQHRAPFKLAGFEQNTWRGGLDRILLGVAMADENQNWLRAALPLDDVGSGDVDLAGRLAELLDRLQTVLDALTGSRPLKDWLETLTAAVDALTSVSAEDGWQSAELSRELGDVLIAAGSRSDRMGLALPDIRSLLKGRLAGRPTRANFRTGTLTVCTMVPMRSVPHRVVCLLGLDDGVFPRNPRPDGDDILARDPAIGERDARGEDRQLMLDAILAATEHLVITYTGADERTGALRPPAVPLGELLDALDETALAPGGRPAREKILIRHPLQPFDSRNVIPGRLGVPGPFSFDRTALAGAIAAAAARHPLPAFLDSPLPPLPVADVDLAEMIELLLHPARGFLKQRLDVATRYDPDEPSDDLTVELDSLAEWAVGDRLLRDRLTGVDEKSCGDVEWRRGLLPPGPLGTIALKSALDEVRPLIDRTAAMLTSTARTVDVVVALAGGRELRGSVARVHGDRIVSVGYSKLGPKPQLAAWISLIALSVAHPGRPWTAIAVGRGDPGSPRSATLGPVDGKRAKEILGQLVDLYDRGMRTPLPLPLRTSVNFADGRRSTNSDDEAIRRANQAWTSGKFPGEDADQSHILIWGSGAPLGKLLAVAPEPDEKWAGVASRLGELSLRLWLPLFENRTLATL